MHAGLLLSVHQSSRMLGRKMSLWILSLLAGSLAGPTLTPAPLIYLDMSSDAPAEGDSVRIVCIAPRAYVDSEFWLQKTDLAQPVQMLFASEGQHRVTFLLGNVTRNDTGQYRCKYRSYHGSAGQMSEFSNVVEVVVTGSLADPTLTPAPLIYLDMSSDAPAEGDSVRIVCIAPRAYVDSEFWLQKTDLAQPVQMLFASEGQHRVTFLLGNVTRNDTGQYRCRYRSYHGSARQMSEFSNVVEVVVTATPPPTSTAAQKASTWLLPVALGVAGVLLLAVALAIVVVALRRVNARRRQLKRDQESCWTGTNFPTTDMSFDNSLFTVSVKAELEAAGSQDACISPGSRKRLNSGTNFSTFKSLQ